MKFNSRLLVSGVSIAGCGKTEIVFEITHDFPVEDVDAGARPSIGRLGVTVRDEDQVGYAHAYAYAVGPGSRVVGAQGERVHVVVVKATDGSRRVRAEFSVCRRGGNFGCIVTDGNRDGALLTHPVVVSYVDGERQVIPIELSRDCVGVRCDPTQRCVRGGYCVSIVWPPRVGVDATAGDRPMDSGDAEDVGPEVADDGPPACPPGETRCRDVCQTVGTMCSVGVGACTRTGTTVCADAGVVCSATPGAPTAETCNGIDDDCDGTTNDECGIWYRPSVSSTWREFPLDVFRSSNPSSPSPHAPSRPIRGAFDVENAVVGMTPRSGVIYALSDSTWHVLNPVVDQWSAPNQQWLASGAITSEVFPMPAMTGVVRWDSTTQMAVAVGRTIDVRNWWNSGIMAAASVPASHPGSSPPPTEGIWIYTRLGTLLYQFDINGRRFSFENAYDTGWRSSGHMPGYADTVGVWIDVTNQNNWTMGLPCGVRPIVTQVWMTLPSSATSPRMHYLDIGECMAEWYNSGAISTYGAFIPTSPPPSMIGDGAYFSNSLYIFKRP